MQHASSGHGWVQGCTGAGSALEATPILAIQFDYQSSDM